MAEVDYMHICDYSFPAEGGKPCIIGIFERITATAFPCHHPVMCIAIQFRGQAHEVIPLVIELRPPAGDAIARAEGSATAGAEGGAFVNLNLVNLRFPEPGRYAVQVASAGRTLVTQTLRLLRQNQAQTQPPSGGHRSH